MSYFAGQVVNFVAPTRSIFLRVGEDSRLFILLKNLGLWGKINSCIVNSTTDVLDPSCFYYVPVKIPQIESLADPNILVNDALLEIARNHDNVKFLYDLSTESITFSDYTSSVLIEFHRILKQHGINPKNVFLVCANANANKYYKLWAKNNKLEDYPITLLGYHFYLYEYWWEVKQCEWLQNSHDTLINSAMKTVSEGKKRNKHFLCLNLRPRSHRTAILLHLLERKHLSKGYVTYFGDEFADHPSVDKQQTRLNFIGNLKSKDRLIPCIEALDKITPLCLDKDSKTMRKDLWDRTSGQVEFLIPEGNDLEHNGIDTYFEIVTETWLTNQSNLYITEKTIRPILRLQPFIHVGSPHLLAYLNKIGFKTFSPFINESYDRVTDPYERLELIFQEIDRLCNMSVDEIHQLYCDLWPRLLHNYRFFKNRLLRAARIEIENNILNKIDTSLTFLG